MSRLARCAAVSLLGLVGCTGAGEPGDTSSGGDSDATCLGASGAYEVEWRTEPAAPIADAPSELWATVLGPDGCPVDDLQQNHERMLHVFVISGDLEHFEHRHMEDQYSITADDLRAATFHFTETFPASGPFRLAFDYAHENQYRTTLDWAEVGGGVPQLDAPVIDPATTLSVDGMDITFTWETPAIATFEAQWALNVTEGGEDVTDLVQYLGADAHAAIVSEDASFVSHTHAWFPGVENMQPGMEMPHSYPGPYLPFHYTFPAAGRYKIWTQFTRADAPETPHLVAFWVEVQP